jgi:hypothetical protein
MEAILRVSLIHFEVITRKLLWGYRTSFSNPKSCIHAKKQLEAILGLDDEFMQIILGREVIDARDTF